MDANKHQNFLQVDLNTLGIKVFYKVILSLLMDMIKYSQSTQSNKFAISLQYLEKEVRNGVQFLHVHKHQNFDTLDCMFLSCHVHISEWIHTLYLPECQGTPCSKQAQYLKFKWLQRDLNPNHLVRKRTLNQLAKLAKWWRLSLRIKWLYVRVPLQSLKFLYVGLLFLMKVVRHVQSTPNKKLVKLLYCIKKKYCNRFCVLL